MSPNEYIQNLIKNANNSLKEENEYTKNGKLIKEYYSIKGLNESMYDFNMTDVLEETTTRLIFDNMLKDSTKGKIYENMIKELKKDNMLQNNISFNAVGCESLPYKIDRTDKEVIDLTLSNEITIDDINLVLSEYSGDKTIHFENNKEHFASLTTMHFYSEGNFKLPSIRLDKNDKSEEISYYISKIDYTEIKDVSDIAQNMYTSQILIRDKKRSTNSSIKHKEEERPIKMFEEAQEREYLDYEHDYENHDWGF